MAALTFFTVTGTYLAATKDSVYDADSEPELVPMSGSITFTPMLSPGDIIPAGTFTPPANVWMQPVTVTLRRGVIMVNGAVGVKLPANTSVLGLDGNLYYRVEFKDGLTAAGKTFNPEGFEFLAPTTATTVDLVEVTPLPGKPAVGNVLPVLSVGGKTGAIILTADDVSDFSAVGRAVARATSQSTARAAIGAVAQADITAAVNGLLAGAPGALDTLKELADALGDDANFAATVTNALSGKQPLDGDLTAIASLTSATNTLPYYTGAGTAALASLSAAGRDFIGADDVTAQRSLIGAPRDAGAFPWPQGLVGLWDFQQDKAGGSTVTSRVGSQTIALTARNSKTVVKDASDPGPFGPSLVLDGATAFVKDGNIGPLDVSVTGDEVTMFVWVKESLAHDDSNTVTERFRAGSHTEAGLEPTAFPARQYGMYYDADLFLGSVGHLTPHVEAQDGASPGYPWSHDHAGSHRKYYTGTGVNQWHMEAFTFDGTQIVAYVDGMSDEWKSVPEPPPSTWGATVLPGYAAQTLDRNPYQQKKGINRSQTTKRFSIGGVVFGYPPNFDAGNFTTGKLGGVAVFNRALTPVEVMKVRLATLLPGEPITVFAFEVSTLGQRPLDEIGWSARANAANNDVSLGVGNDYRVSRASGATKASLRKSTTTIGACWGPVTGLNAGQIKRLRFKMMSDATTSAAQRLLVKVGSQWWASNTAYSMAAAGASTLDWSLAETKTHNVSWDVGQWLAVTMADTGSTTTFQNLAKNPALTANATGWAVSGQSSHATGARVSDGAGGYVYRLTWTGTDAHGSGPGTGGTASLANTSIGTVTPGNVYNASMVVKPSKNQNMNLEMYWYDSGGAFIIATTPVPVTSVLANTATTLTMSGTAPAGAAGVAVRAVTSTYGGTDWVSGDTLDLTKVMVTTAAGVTYFDGSTAGASWDGTAGASTSSLIVNSGTLALGAANTSFIDNALITAVGFLSSGGDGSVVRVTDLELLPN